MKDSAFTKKGFPIYILMVLAITLTACHRDPIVINPVGSLNIQLQHKNESNGIANKSDISTFDAFISIIYENDSSTFYGVFIKDERLGFYVPDPMQSEIIYVAIGLPFRVHVTANYGSEILHAESDVMIIENDAVTVTIELGSGTINISPYTDLGLPSGNLWATCNLGASSPKQSGLFFAWGETETKDLFNWATYSYCNGSESSLNKYCNNPAYGNNGFADNISTLEYFDDAARSALGTGWYIPTTTDFEELIAYCHTEWTTQNGIGGYRITGQNGNSIFLPASGGISDGHKYSEGVCGFYWLNSTHNEEPCYSSGIYADEGSINTTSYYRMLGQTIRPVYKNITEYEYVDMGLPSGNMWAKCNIGASSPEQSGFFFAWGETTSKDVFNWETYIYCNGTENTLNKYCNNSTYGFVDNIYELEHSDDAATAAYGNGWHIPAVVDFEELIAYCHTEWTTLNGIGGYQITGQNGNSIFLPASGGISDNHKYSEGVCGYYWLNSIHNGEPCYSSGIYVDEGSINTTSYYRKLGQTIRPIHNRNRKFGN